MTTKVPMTAELLVISQAMSKIIEIDTRLSDIEAKIDLLLKITLQKPIEDR